MINDVDDGEIPQSIWDLGTKVYNKTLLRRWLVGSEPLLLGRRPIDVIRAGDIGAVLDALIAISSDGFA